MQHMTSPELTEKLLRAGFPRIRVLGNGFILTEILAELPATLGLIMYQKTCGYGFDVAIKSNVLWFENPKPCDAAAEVWLKLNGKEGK